LESVEAVSNMTIRLANLKAPGTPAKWGTRLIQAAVRPSQRGMPNEQLK
jgi:hypothetical protein